MVTRPHCFLFTCSCSVLTSVSLCLPVSSSSHCFTPLQLNYLDAGLLVKILYTSLQPTPQNQNHSSLSPAYPSARCFLWIIKKTRLEPHSFTHLSDTHSVALPKASQPLPASKPTESVFLSPPLINASLSEPNQTLPLFQCLHVRDSTPRILFFIISSFCVHNEVC